MLASARALQLIVAVMRVCPALWQGLPGWKDQALFVEACGILGFFAVLIADHQLFTEGVKQVC